MAIHLNAEIGVEQKDYGNVARVYDKTGTNDGVNFPDGFSDGVNGTDNPRKDEVDQVILRIAKSSLIYTVTLTGTDLANFLDITIGYNLNSETAFGAGYPYFEDGIYTITATYSGSTIDDNADAWEADEEIYEAFLWNLWEKIRTLTIGVHVPIENYIESLSVSVVNLIFDGITYLCQYGDVTNAESTRKFLTELVENNSSLTEIFKNIKSYE